MKIPSRPQAHRIYESALEVWERASWASDDAAFLEADRNLVMARSIVIQAEIADPTDREIALKDFAPKPIKMS